MCLVIQPDSVVLQIDVDCKAKGQDCLGKVCEHLGIVETDYFGLLYLGSKGERFWLNLRNPINQQLPGSAPYRLHLRVKFFVQPHFLLQETTRYQFYLNVKQDFKEMRLKCWSATQVATVAALVAQAELGDRCPNSPSQLLQYQRFTDCCDLALLDQKHALLKGMTSTKAQYQLIQEASTLDSYGVEYHEVKDADETGHVGVGPSGIDIYDANWQFIKKMEYPVVQMVTHDGRAVFVHLVGDQGLTLIHSFKLGNDRAASAFYRCVIEMYSFYRCDTVRQAVASRYSRDLKGTLASLFNENTSLGKKYVFDIQRTAKESYDRARRVLYSLETSVAKPHLPSEGNAKCPDVHKQQTVIDEDCELHDCQKAKIQLQTMREALLCRVCMDQNVNTVLCPCGHMACCRECTLRLDSCPLCRQPIANIQNVFLPDLSCDAS